MGQGRDTLALFFQKNMNTLVAIKSCHKYGTRRQAIAETWLPELDTDFFFILGRPAALPHVPDAFYCDVSDAFADIAPKIYHACLYALESNVDFMFVCDDDTYLRPDRLMRSGFEKHDYCGFVRTIDFDVPYMQGSAYWLSARAMELIVNSKVMVPGVIDDGAVGRALLDKVAFVHDYRYNPGPHVMMDSVPHPSNNLISCHKCLPETMRVVHIPWRKQ